MRTVCLMGTVQLRDVKHSGDGCELHNDANVLGATKLDS